MNNDFNPAESGRALQRQRRIRVALFVGFGLLFAIVLSFLYQGVQTLSSLEQVEHERDQWQRSAEVIRELNAQEGSAVVDFGSGVGYFALKLSRSVGEHGRVIAVDIQKFPLYVLRTRAVLSGRHNISTVLGASEDPHLDSGSADAVLIANTYHELDRPDVILAHVMQSLKPGGRLVIIDHAEPSLEGEPRDVEAEHHQIAPALVEADLQKAGFQILLREDHFAVQTSGGQVWWLMVARKPA